MIRYRLAALGILFFLVSACSSIQTNTEFYDPVINDLQKGNFEAASVKLDKAETEEEYSEKDRVIKHLDKGIIYHYLGDYERSNAEFEKAEIAIEDLYTKSISKGAVSFLLNDNALEYDGEVYEDLYLNIFKALNYLHLNKFDDAYVEVNRVNNKLKELDIYYEEMVDQFNNSEDSKIKIDPKKLEYYNNVLANYISHLIFRAEGELDNSRISIDKLNEAWDTYPDVYDYEKPLAVTETGNRKDSYLNIIAFAGLGPQKEAVGARITTFDGFVTVSDPTEFNVQPIPFPGVKYGWNFKFEFPQLVEDGTEVHSIEVLIDNTSYGYMQLLENMANVARKTFESEKSLIYFKTVARAVAKGIASSSLGRELSSQSGGGFLGDLIKAATNAAFDATEHADLRNWRTMPGYCFVSEYLIEPGMHDISINFLDGNGNVISRKSITNFNIERGMNLIEAVHLN